MGSENYSLDDLSALTGVPHRTIRFYIHEKLIPSPSGRGRKSRYGHAHLAGLVTIQQLQDQGLALKDIAAAMALMPRDLSPSADVSSGEPSETSGKKTTKLPRAIRESMAKARAKAADLAQRPPVAVPFHGSRNEEQPVTVDAPSHWERIPISPEIEIHVRRPLNRERQKALRELLDRAAELFAEGGQAAMPPAGGSRRSAR